MMNKFENFSATVAAFDRSNIDTDAIIPKQYLKSIKRSGFGINLFDDWRYLDPGEPGQDHSQRRLNPDFVLNREPYRRGAQILLARENFACGSSREHAVWALMDFGIKVVIAPSFADIFYNNSFKTGLLPIALADEQVDLLFSEAAATDGYQLAIDLKRSTGAYSRRCRNGIRNRRVSQVLPVEWPGRHRPDDAEGRAHQGLRAAVLPEDALAEDRRDKMTAKIAILAGDGIGPEIMTAALGVLDCLQQDFGLSVELEHAAIGGAGYDQYGQPLPEATLDICQQADAILFGAIGGPKYDTLERDLRPEKGLLKLALRVVAVFQPAPGDPVSTACRGLESQARAGGRPRSDDCARTDRWHLFR